MFFANRRVEPSADYIYDALYRLVEATGREHLGQGGAPQEHGPDDAGRVNRPHPGDGGAMGAYVERYLYDAVGNILELRHRTTDPAHPGWTRGYDYAETSRIENGTSGLPAKSGNRLGSTSTAAGGVQGYDYDPHGNLVRAPHLGGPGANLHWDEGDRLRRVDLGGGGVAYFVHDAGGQRIRKIWEKSAALVEERIYLGGFEIFRRRQGANLLERETLHVMDDTRRIALVETRTADSAGNDAAPAQAIRYQFGNHLGSASIELDEAARIVSYEEFTPYGSSAYHAVRSQTETAKRYRFTGKERDEETGFYYHGARYYAPWLGRWIACDPAGLADGLCSYGYARCNPIGGLDPTGAQTAPPPDVANALDGALDALGGDQPFSVQGKAGMRSIPLTMDIDEPNPVGQKNISPTEARARALDINNRQFLDPATNRNTKWLGVDPKSAPATGNTVSAAKNPNALLTRKFGDIAEMRSIFDEAVGKIKNPGKMTPTQLKNAINSHMWDIIKTGTSDDAVKIREALGKLGFQNVKGVGYVMKAPAAAGTTSRVLAAVSKTVQPLVTKAAPIVAKAAPVVQKAAPIVAKVAPVVKAVAAPLAKYAGPLGIGVSGVQLATAKTTEERVDAGIGLTSSVLMSSRHPVAVAAGGGLMAGQLIDKGTNASTHASDAGIYVYENLRETWVGDTGAFVLGGATTIIAIPSAIGYGAAERISSWFD
ncbi:RHS repeat-associated core domain-containing protein [Leptolyngbya sp. 15MV]|nr:RHS repeat-associated core domain-containing protein [Leptolyngbya sp. 15MV]